MNAQPSCLTCDASVVDVAGAVVLEDEDVVVDVLVVDWPGTVDVVDEVVNARLRSASGWVESVAPGGTPTPDWESATVDSAWAASAESNEDTTGSLAGAPRSVVLGSAFDGSDDWLESTGMSATGGSDGATWPGGEITEVVTVPVGSIGFSGSVSSTGDVVVAVSNVDTARSTLLTTDSFPPLAVDLSPDAELGITTMSVLSMIDSSGAPTWSGVMLNTRTPTRTSPMVAVEAMSRWPSRDVGSCGGAASSEG